MKETPKQFIKRWCAENGVNHLELMAAARSRARRDLTVLLKRTYPSLSSTQVGALLNIDHSTVLYTWWKAGIKQYERSAPLTAAEITRIKALSGRGLKRAEIAKLTGRSRMTVDRALNPEFLVAHAQKKRDAEREASRIRQQKRRAAQAELLQKRAEHRKMLKDRQVSMI